MRKIELSKALQIVTISPLIIGIIACVISSLAIMFTEHLTWLEKSRTELKSAEMLHFNNVSESFSQSFDELINTVYPMQVTYSLIFISKIYEGVQNGTLEQSNFLNQEFIRFESISSIFQLGLNFNVSMWYSTALNSLEELSETDYKALNITNPFLKGSYHLIDAFISGNQIGNGIFKLGLILDNGVNFIYPGSNPDLWLNCNKTEDYEPLNTQLYKNRINGGLNIIHECSYFTISLGFPYGVVVYYMYYSYFHQSLLSSLSSDAINKLTLFIASTDLTQVIFLSSSEEDYEKSLCSALYSNYSKLEKECEKNYETDLTNTKNLTFIEYNNVILGSYSPFKINATVQDFSVTQTNQLLVGVARSQRIVLEGLNNIIEEALDIIFFQLAILIAFILFSILISWKLSKIISNRIFLPISIISRMLSNTASDEETQSLYNSEVNKVIEYIKLLNTFEKFIDPYFLENPLPNTRIKNLTEAYNMFKSLKNYRGMSITQNLIGNAYFSIKNYEMAKESYSLSLNSTIKLLNKLEKIEKTHESLNMNESKLLRKHTGRNKRSWNDQKMYLIENIAERKQQLCMTLEAMFINYDDEDATSRKKLKEINKYQLEILEYYISTRTHFFSMVRVLLNMAKIFEYLKYFHSGLQLLEIVKDELIKIKGGECIEVDIDITRLRSIGISLKLEDSTSNSKHFIINNISHEKDILMQEMHLRKGMILIKSQKIQDAAHSFTSAIEYGDYFDPNIRLLALNELEKLFEENNLLNSAKDFQEIQSNLQSIQNSILFVLIYDVELEKDLNKALVDFFKSGIDKIKNSTGIILDNRFNDLHLELEQRDMPEFDLEDLLNIAKKQIFSVNLYDPLVSAIYKFKEDSTSKVVVAVIMEKPNFKGAAKLKHLYLFKEKEISLIVMYTLSALTTEFKDFIEDEDIPTICIDNHISFEESLDHLKSLLSSICQSRKPSTKKSQKLLDLSLNNNITHL